MDIQEFETRVRACTQKLWRCAWAILGNEADCADAVQEALLRAWQKRNTLRRPEYFETWLMRILVNQSRSLLRSRGRVVPSELPEQPAPGDGLSTEMRDALQQLPLRLRLPFLLRHIGGYSTAEIAAMQHISPSTVRRRIDAARREMQHALGEEEK